MKSFKDFLTEAVNRRILSSIESSLEKGGVDYFKVENSNEVRFKLPGGYSIKFDGVAFWLSKGRHVIETWDRQFSAERLVQIYLGMVGQ